MYINVAGMLSSYGTDITVYKPAQAERVGGFDFGPSFGDPEKRHEPVLPANTAKSILASFVTGGQVEDYDLVWLSTGQYPLGTKVEAKTQGKTCKVVGIANYTDYSNLYVYELKGDSQHDQSSSD